MLDEVQKRLGNWKSSKQAYSKIPDVKESLKEIIKRSERTHRSVKYNQVYQRLLQELYQLISNELAIDGYFSQYINWRISNQ